MRFESHQLITDISGFYSWLCPVTLASRVTSAKAIGDRFMSPNEQGQVWSGGALEH